MEHPHPAATNHAGPNDDDLVTANEREETACESPMVAASTRRLGEVLALARRTAKPQDPSLWLGLARKRSFLNRNRSFSPVVARVDGVGGFST